MTIEGARRVIETDSADTANQYLRFGWKLINQYTVPATTESPPKVSYVLASMRSLEDTKHVVRETQWEMVNQYLDLGWKLIDKYVTAAQGGDVRDEVLYFILAWQREEKVVYLGEQPAEPPVELFTEL